jgi:hypothetical protein
MQPWEHPPGIWRMLEGPGEGQGQAGSGLLLSLRLPRPGARPEVRLRAGAL